MLLQRTGIYGIYLCNVYCLEVNSNTREFQITKQLWSHYGSLFSLIIDIDPITLNEQKENYHIILVLFLQVRNCCK